MHLLEAVNVDPRPDNLLLDVCEGERYADIHAFPTCMYVLYGTLYLWRPFKAVLFEDIRKSRSK